MKELAARLDALKSCAKANAGECIVRATDFQADAELAPKTIA